MCATSFGHRTARRVAIAALFVMAPAWLSACNANDNAEKALTSPASASFESGPVHSASGASRRVTFDDEAGKAAVSLPLVGVPTEYGVDVDGSPPTILPAADLPAQGFVVPKKLASRLAVYWMNLGYEGRGFMMLAPKGWTVTGSVGANGSFGMHAENPADAGQFLDTIDTAGSCQGCAIADIGAYFPELAEWAEEQGFPADKPKAYLSSKPVGDRMIEFTEAPGNDRGGYGVLGAAYEEHEGGSLFRTARTGYAEADQAVAETMIAFYEWMYGDR
ncbi:DUF4850 domain-containing protein [Cohnella sp. GCM10012308]|uniref:DUF4850 domain-containing protein n=1 Tax=Cohnella sp. GCM10012308 TaxID=3317329 RepID=UPI0036150546